MKPAVWLARRQVRKFAEWNEERVGAAKGIRWMLRYVFPDHWSFLLGEIALYSFMVLVATGIFLACFYQPGDTQIIYHGPYGPLAGMHMSEAFHSVLDISMSVPAGLLIRQTHHWAADVFMASIVLHCMRIFFTGAFRKPRDFNWYIGLTMLGMGMLEGFAGYSLVDDLMSGMGIAIAYGVAMSVPLVGGQMSNIVFDGQFPGGSDFLARLEIVHVLLIPAALAILISVHLAMVMRQHHSQFKEPGHTESNVVGTPLWPGYALRSIGLLLAVAGVLFLLGGLVQVNPIWQWGPYEPYLSTNGAQPDWYLGWLIGALRLMPNFEPTIGSHTLIPNPFWGGAFFPTVVFGILYLWPAGERFFTGDRAHHDLLDRPRDRPVRTALGAALLSWVVLIFAVGAADRVSFRLDISYAAQIRVWRIGIWVVPVVVFFLTRAACRALARSGAHPLRGWQGTTLARTESGGFELFAAGSTDAPDHTLVSEEPEPSEPGRQAGST